MEVREEDAAKNIHIHILSEVSRNKTCSLDLEAEEDADQNGKVVEKKVMRKSFIVKKRRI